MPWPRALTTLAPALAAPLIAVGAFGAVRSGEAPSIVAGAAGVLVGAVSLVAAWIVARRAPSNAVAPVLGWMGLAAIAVTALDSYPEAAEPGPVLRALSALTAGCWMWWFVPVGMLLVIFPDGRVANRLGRVTLIALPATACSFQILGAFGAPTLQPPLEHLRNPLPYWPVAGIAAVLLLPVFLGLLVTAVISAIQRYRRAGGLVRDQLRWLRLVGIALPITLLLCWLSYLLLDGPDLVGFGLLTLYVGIPVVAALALTRHDRYDADEAVASAAAYAVMVAVLLGAFSAVSIGSGLLIGRDSFPLAVTVTALVAFCLGATRRRMLGAVGRLLFPARERAIRAVGDLKARIEAGRGEPEDVGAVLAGALRDPGLTITDGPDRPAPAGLPPTAVVLGGSTIAHLVPGPAAPRRIPREVADAAALLIETVRLRAALALATREIEASRERLVVAGYAERRRLERDLHDGAQQRLVSLGMSLRLIQRALPGDAGRLAGDLDRAVAEIGTTVAELRLLAHGLRPSSLDDGLPAALAYLAHTSAVPLDLQVCEIDLPERVSTTAYFVVSEAVANAIKHADAGRITVRVDRDGDGIGVVVTDDGRGGASPRPGSGLAGLADRVAAVGGRLDVRSDEGTGTTVKVLLPCGS